ncbi:hypothetical protein ACVWZL_002147 [Bradyrhizobium sp. GM2.4]
MVARDISGELDPHVAGITKTVDQDHDRPLTADANMNLRAVGRDGFGLEAGRKLFDLGARGRGEQHEKNGETSCAHRRLRSSCISVQ